MCYKASETVSDAADGQALYEAEHLSSSEARPFDFRIAKGEVNGFTGLLGSGRSESVRAIFGADYVTGGTVSVDGKPVKISRPVQAMKQGIGYLPENRRRDVLLIGKSGLGKTFLMHCMANRLLERGKDVLLISSYAFLQSARKSYFENDHGTDELLQAPVLFLDDLGSEPLMQNVTIEQLLNLINERQSRRLPTVISTNLSIKELRTRYTERIASRLTDSRNCLVITLEGQDIRRSGRT